MNALTRMVQRVGAQPALDKTADRLSWAIDKGLAKVKNRQAVEDALHGTWFGHPLHPPLTSLPVGAFSFAAAMDTLAMLRGRRSSSGTAAIGFGVLSTLPVAAAGAADWRQTDGEARRVGVAHALLNGGAMALYVASLLLRGRKLGVARALSFAGFGLLGISGYFGGHLLVHYRVGVKHEAEPAGTPVFTEATLDQGLEENTPKLQNVDETPLMVVRHAGRIYVLSDICPHLGCSLSNGTVEGDAIVCPCHGSAFALADGRVLRGPSVFAVQAYAGWAVDDDATPGPILDTGME